MKLRDTIGSLNPERVRSIRIIVLCILAAGTFWFLNALNDSYSATLKYPITFVYDQEKYIAVKPLPDKIQLNVSGLGWNLFRNNIGLSEVPVQILLDRPAEIKKLPSSTLLGTISDQLAEFQVNFILTDTLFLNIDRRIAKKFSLQVDSASIRLEENHWIVAEVTFQPDSVTLDGPESILSSMRDTLMVSIPEDNIDEDYDEEIPIPVVSAQLINRNPPTISISFEVEEYEESTYGSLIQTINFPEDSSALVSQAESMIRFQIASVNKRTITDSSFLVIADFENLNQADSTLPVLLKKTPEFVRNAQIDSTLVKVIFNEK